MTRKVYSKAPRFMADADHEKTYKRFHNQDIVVFEGDVLLERIEGWRGNPRTELHYERFLSQFGRPPTNDEMFQLVVADDDPKEGLKIIELAGNIHKNGVRVPMVLTYEGKLLDGNRRYYACMFLFENAKTKQEKERFSRIPAYVLAEETSEATEDAIITEFNFAPDFHKEWPYYIRARQVLRDQITAKMSKEDLVKKYGVEWKYLDKWIRAAELCEKFEDYHGQSFLAKQFAYRHFIMFDEMMRNFGKRFNDSTFRNAIFDVLLVDFNLDSNLHRFTESKDVIRLDEIYDNADAWDALMARKGPQALKDALREVEDSSDATPDPNKKLKSVIKTMEKLQGTGGINVAEPQLLTKFHSLAEQAPGAPKEPDTRVKKMIEWLDSMTARQIAELKPDTVGNLRQALERVLQMAEAVSENGKTKSKK